MSGSKGARPVLDAEDLGLRVVGHAFATMQIDEEWSVREPRGFTWWGAWCRERIWADEAIRSDGDTMWHVRARTPALRDVQDEPATYELVDELNSMISMCAFVYDPEDATVSARCGAFIYGQVAGWLERWFMTAAALTGSLAWGQVPPQAAGRALDDAPHPTSGVRRDTDDMLHVAGSFHAPGPPISAATFRAVADALAAQDFPADYDDEEVAVRALFPFAEDQPALSMILCAEHPLFGWGVLTRVVIPRPDGPLRGPWLANALNLAESADWRGEQRPHALGAWRYLDDALIHFAFFPGAVMGEPDPDEAGAIVQNLLAWGGVRTRFAGERLPWLEAAAASRYPVELPLK